MGFSQISLAISALPGIGIGDIATWSVRRPVASASVLAIPGTLESSRCGLRMADDLWVDGTVPQNVRGRKPGGALRI